MTICAVVVAWREELAPHLQAPDEDDIGFAIFVLMSLLFFMGLVLGGQWFVARCYTELCYRLGLLTALRFIVGRKMLAFALFNWGRRLQNANDRDTAIHALSEAIRFDPGEVEYLVDRGIANYSAGYLDAAISDFSRAIQMAPHVKHVYIRRGYAHFAKGMFEQARDDLSHRSDHQGIDAPAACYRGKANEELSAWDLAAEDYRIAIHLDSSQTDAVLAMARLQAGCPQDSLRDGEKAIENARRVCILTEWNDWVALSILAAGYAEVGDFESAVRFAREAADRAPEAEAVARLARIRQYEQGLPFRIAEE